MHHPFRALFERSPKGVGFPKMADPFCLIFQKKPKANHPPREPPNEKDTVSSKKGKAGIENLGWAGVGEGGGWGLGGGGGGGVLTGKKRLKSHHVHPSKHEFARRVSVTRGARMRPACFIVGTQCVDRWWQSLQNYVPNSASL